MISFNVEKAIELNIPAATAVLFLKQAYEG